MIKFAKIRDVKSPSRGTKDSAGIDLYVPKFDETFIKAFNIRNPDAQSQALFDIAHNNIQIRPHGRVFIPSGLYVNFSDEDNSALITFNKSGFSWEGRMQVLACVVDSGYEGELFITMFNFSDYPTIILQEQKLVQLVRVPVYYDEINIVDKDTIFVNSLSERKEGSMGSTGEY